MLYDPDRHEALVQIPWDERLARETIHEITADTEAAFDSDRFWPSHPREDGEGLLKGIWNGAAGTIWGLNYLHRCAGISPQRDWSEAADRLHGIAVAGDDPPYYEGSFLMGALGVLLVKWRLTRQVSDADLLFASIEKGTEAPTNELMWGTPGAVLAASFMWELTGNERWRDLYLSRAMQLYARWKYSAEHGCYVWHQRLYQPEPEVYVGLVHGFTGNICALLRGADLLDDSTRHELYQRAATALAKTAHLDHDTANWLGIAAEAPPGRAFPWLVQWCHGAPGTLGALSALPRGFDQRFDDLFLSGAELTWRAGPLVKGPNLCHGTAGNGYLLIKAYWRTGDEKWLARARSFAMHAIVQYKALKKRTGRGWYSLWTGDIGTAIYLWQCIAGEGGFPTMDMF